VAAVCYFRVTDPARAITGIEAFEPATSQIAQTTLRSVLGRAELDQLLAERERLNEDLKRIIDEQTEPWGIEVTAVEIKDVEIPEAMQRAMARQAEAERERRAKVIGAEGEYQAAEKLAAAGGIIGESPAALQLRYLQEPRRGGRRGTLDDRVPRAGRHDEVAPRPRPCPRRGRAVDLWEVIRYLHVLGLALFIGGQIMLVVAIVPVLRGQPEELMLGVARRFGIAIAVALALVVGTGVAMASKFSLWEDETLQAKLAVLVLVLVLLGLHIASPRSRVISLSMVASSLVVAWLGVALTH
jgi:uncharacterized membrane protein